MGEHTPCGTTHTHAQLQYIHFDTACTHRSLHTDMCTTPTVHTRTSILVKQNKNIKLCLWYSFTFNWILFIIRRQNYGSIQYYIIYTFFCIIFDSSIWKNKTSSNAFRKFCITANHQAGEQMESIKVCVSGSTHIYSKSVCLAMEIVGLTLVKLCSQVRPGASRSDTVSPPLSLSPKIPFNVGKCGHSRPAERFNQPH